MGYTGVVHTKSSYNNANIDFSSLPKTIDIDSKILALRDKENSTYAKLFPGCNNIEQFVAKLRELFQDSEEDSRVFRFFENNNIKPALRKKFGTTTKKQQDIIITINNIDNTIDLQSILAGTGAEVIASGGNATINLGVNVFAIKKAFNRLFSTRLNEASANKRRLNELLSNSQSLTDALKIDDEEGLITVSSSGKIQSERFAQSIIVPGSIFSYTAEDIRAAINLGETSELYRELEEARQQINDFIKEESGYYAASQEMQKAVDNVWNRNIAGSLKNLALFEKGGVLNALAGAFGEFQAALLIEYVNLKVKNSVLGNSLIADTLKSGEQAKADVTFLGDIGIQVKNYNSFSADRGYSKLDVKTHPNKLVQFPDFPISSTDFLDFLANYYFNKDYQSKQTGTFKTLEETLQEFFAEVANLAITEQVSDLVTFYFIEGRYFVPGSYILEGWREQQVNAEPIQIRGPDGALGDDEFNYTEIRKKKRKESLFSKWWVKSSASGWHPRNPQNRNTYSNLVSSQISIYSSFNYREITSRGGFSLF